MKQIVLLTGPKGVGKTTASADIAMGARGNGLSVGGVIAPSRLDERGNKTGSNVVSLVNRQQKHLATIDRANSQDRTVGSYRFDEAVFAWALDQVMMDLRSPLDLVIIDEIGRLEMLQGKGFVPALELLPKSVSKMALLVVRQSALDWTTEQLCAIPTSAIEMSRANRHLIVDLVLATLLE